MKIDPVIVQPLILPNKQLTAPGENNNDFNQLLNKSLEQLNKTQVNADEVIKQFLTGDVQDLHHVVIAVEKAKTSMQLAVQVRNKVLEAYQEMMRMQV